MSDEKPVFPSRVWWRADAFIHRNPKVARRLKSDSERWAYVVTLGEAKVQQVEGEWASREHYELALGDRLAEHVDALLAAGLLDQDDDGVIRVHDWSEWQVADRTSAERSRRYREKKRLQRDGTSRNVATRDDTHTPLHPISPHKTPPHPPPAASGGPWSDFTEDEWEPFRESWTGRGFRLPPYGKPTDDNSQRALLWRIAEARPTDLGRWVAEAPPSCVAPREVIDYVLAKWRQRAAA